tara:strand:- start:1211 stop:1633 length:423 start_codon:yes stop_codon:yes gene_type:complete
LTSEYDIMSIDVTKLKKNTKILLETEDTVFEIIVTGPKSCSAKVHGGTKFIKPTKVTIVGVIEKKSNKKRNRPVVKEGHIEKNKCIEFVYTKNPRAKDKMLSTLITSPVLSAKIYSPCGEWNYDAIEKDADEERIDEDIN